jgi:hypothetical protein
VFEVGYFLTYPGAIWALSAGAISSIVVVAISTGLLMGLNVAATGETGFGARLGFISASLFCLLFQFDIPILSPTTFFGIQYGGVPGIPPPANYAPHLPVGLGLVYPNMFNIFVVPGDTSPVGMFGMIIMSIIIFLFVVSGVLIAAGEHG